MAVKFRQVGFKLYDQLINGSDFSQNLDKYKSNLAGFVGGKYKAVNDFTLNVSFFNKGDTSLNYQIDFTDNWLSYPSVDWINEGFNVGDVVDFNYEFNDITYTIINSTISSIVDDRLYFVDLIPLGTTLQWNSNGKFSVYLSGAKQSIRYSFGFVENSDEYSNNSLLTGASQTYYGTCITDNTLYDLEPLGQVKDWVSGASQFQYKGSNGVFDINGFQTGLEFNYEVNHEFLLNPFYEEGDISNLKNENGVIQPPYLAGDFSLKYVYEPELSRELSNPNTAISYKSDSFLGSVAYYNENFNGFNNPYTVKYVYYRENATNEYLTGINPNSTTRLEFRISKSSSITQNHIISFNIFKCSGEQEYTNTTSTNLEENFLFDNLLCDVGSTETGTGIITEVNVTAETTTDFIGYAIIEYSLDDQKKIKEGDFFLISVAVTDTSLTAGNEDVVNLLLDVEQYDKNADISGLATMPIFDIYDPKAEDGYSSIYSFVEDNIHAKCQLDLNLNQLAYINNLSTKLIAYNPINYDYFELDSYNIDYTEVDVNGLQQLTYNDTKNYPDSITDEQNYVRLSIDDFDREPKYLLEFGQKINWKDWVKNLDANTLFYDLTKPNDNLNYKSSNYNVNDYEIRLGVQANIYGTDNLGNFGNTDYLFLSQKLRTADYNSNPDIDGYIELFDVENGTSLGTSPRSDKDTLFKCTWFNQTLNNAWGVNRIERSDNVGNEIFEMSNLTYYVGGILKPIEGETILKLIQVGQNIEATCLIDYTKLEQGVNYNLSSRINLTVEMDPNTKLKTSGVVKLKTDQVVKLKAI